MHSKTHIEQIKIEHNEDAPVDVKEKPEIGDFIRLKDGSTIGELLEINANKATILMNGMRVSTQSKNLVKVQVPKPKKEPKFVTEFVAEPVTVGSRIDLRGKRGDESIAALETYLDEISRSGLSQVEIIHGKGNGILSKLVREYLAGRKEIIRFEFAPYDQGGPGCTLAYFS